MLRVKQHITGIVKCSDEFGTMSDRIRTSMSEMQVHVCKKDVVTLILHISFI